MRVTVKVIRVRVRESGGYRGEGFIEAKLKEPEYPAQFCNFL